MLLLLGGGPVGCAAARDLAEAGFKVLVAEDHSQIGEPLRCSGLISSRTLQLSRVSPNVVCHKLTGARVHAPGGEVMDLSGTRVYALAVDRVAFDRDLAEQAAAAGAQIVCCAKAVDLEFVAGGVRVKLQKRGYKDKIDELTCRLVIGADGYRSLVARRLGVLSQGKKIPLYAAEVELPNSEGQIVDIFIGNQVAPGWFGWVIPTGQGMARIGIGAHRCPRQFFQLLVERYPRNFHGMSILQGTSGYVRVGHLDRIYGPHTLLVGDAACQIKPISGGGLYLGLEGAALCAATAEAALSSGDLSEEFLSRYQGGWGKKLGVEINCGLKHREVFLGLTDEEMDSLIRFLNKPHWRKLILKYGDLDYHSALARKLSYIPFWARHFFKNGFKFMLACCSLPDVL